MKVSYLPCMHLVHELSREMSLSTASRTDATTTPPRECEDEHNSSFKLLASSRHENRKHAACERNMERNIVVCVKFEWQAELGQERQQHSTAECQLTLGIPSWPVSR